MTRFSERPPAAAELRRRPRSGLVGKMIDAQKRERDVILGEFDKARGLMPLLMKHRNGGSWSRAERAELHDRLRALAHLSPYLFVLMLPGSFVFLPALAWWLDRRRHRRETLSDGSG